MTPPETLVDMMGFLSKITATATHDLKNYLAVINENAGLMEDLSMLTKNGRPLSPEKVLSVAGKIKHQVGRSDRVLKLLNRFAHLIDAGQNGCDLENTVRIIQELSSRLADRWGVSLQVISPKTQVHVPTDPLVTAFLTFKAVEIVCTAAEATSQVILTISAAPKGLQVSVLKPAKEACLSSDEVTRFITQAAGSGVTVSQTTGLELTWDETTQFN